MGTAVTQLGAAEYESQLQDDIAEFYDDPYGFIMYAFNWGHGDLSDFDGPDDWQKLQLMRIGQAFVKNPHCTIREAVASGHGIGKSTMVAWLILWAMSTRPDLNGVITANTTTQLHTKTWRELAVWHKRLINGHWYKWTATKFFHTDHPETWFVGAVPNTEHNSEAFAGLHGLHVLLIYDEASGIPDKIWEVSEGAMTTPRAMWLVYGNPTKNTGRFRSCFQEDSHRWITRQIDSRTCKMTNKSEIAEQLKTYGEDSDFARVRVLGQFPRAGTMQFMPSDLVDASMEADMPLENYMLMPVIMSVDVARYGDDKSVVLIRQGRKVLKLYKYREMNTMQLSTEVAALIREVKPDAVFVDVVGVGGGVVDRLRQLGHDVIEVNGGVAAQDDETYANKRAEMWGRMKEWFYQGADIPPDKELRTALIGLEYGFDTRERIQLERKKDMKSRGLDSPDEGDALAHTFSEIVVGRKQDAFEPDDYFEPDVVEAAFG